MRLLSLLFVSLFIFACQEVTVDNPTDSGSDSGQVGPVLPQHDPVPQVDTAIITETGRYVRVGGASITSKDIVNTTKIGDVVIVQLSDNLQCVAAFLAKEKNGQPDIAVKGDFVKVGAKDKLNKFVWHGLFSGQSCAAITSLGSDFLGSAMEDLIALPLDVQSRFLKTSGTCIDSKTKASFSCTLPVGDAKADLNAEVFFPNQWAGLALNFRVARGGKVVH